MKPDPLASTLPNPLNGQQLRFPVSALHRDETILECERAIYALKTGYAERWQTPEQYIEAFKKFGDPGTWNNQVRPERERMIAFLALSLPERHAMDEQAPLDVLVTRTIRALERSRDEALSVEAKSDQ